MHKAFNASIGRPIEATNEYSQILETVAQFSVFAEKLERTTTIDQATSVLIKIDVNSFETCSTGPGQR
jgi:hypothetical protein